MGMICCHLNVAVRRVSRVLFRCLVHFLMQTVPNYSIFGQMKSLEGREKKMGEQLIFVKHAQ
jgi:hypothetical protein